MKKESKAKRIVLSIVAIFLPWLVLLIKDNPGGAVVAVIMQATLIGWPFATVWAWRLVNPPKDGPVVADQD